MRRIVAAALLALGLLLAAPARSADAASPAPAAETSDDTTEDGRPWGRLAIFVPVCIAIGAAAVYGRRLARDRGWTQS